MAEYPYTKGLHDLGNGAWAYLQPDGSSGWSNAGLIVDEEAALDISIADFDGWFDAERIVINLQTLYGEYAGKRPSFDRIKLFGMMARYARSR